MKQSLEQIAGKIELLTGFTIVGLRSRAHTRALAVARQLFCFFAHEDGCSYSEIGRYINRDHPTVMYSCMTVKSMKDTDQIFKELIEQYDMSEKKQILEITPPEYDNDFEKTQCTGFRCTRCNGTGSLKDWSAKRDDPVMYDCDRCGGSGRLKANVEIRWSAEAKENTEVLERQIDC